MWEGKLSSKYTKQIMIFFSLLRCDFRLTKHSFLVMSCSYTFHSIFILYLRFLPPQLPTSTFPNSVAFSLSLFIPHLSLSLSVFLFISKDTSWWHLTNKQTNKKLLFSLALPYFFPPSSPIFVDPFPLSVSVFLSHTHSVSISLYVSLSRTTLK